MIYRERHASVRFLPYRQIVVGAFAALCAVFGIFWIIGVHPAHAAPTTLNFQGRLLDATGVPVADGLYNMQFKLYDASSAGTLLWSETRENSSPDYRVQVTNGLFTTKLGSRTALTASVFSGNSVYFEITQATPATATCSTAACASWESPMSPRHQLSTSAYAYNAETLDGLDSTAFAAASGSVNYIQNTTTPQTADFAISGTGRIDTALQAPSIQRNTNGTLLVGTTNTTAGMTLGGTSLTGALVLDSGAASTITIGSSASARTINIGNVAAVQTVTLGSSNTTSSTTIQGGASGSITMTTGGTINLNAGTIATNATTANFLNTTATTVNAFGAATTIAFGASSGTATINNTNVTVGNTTSRGTFTNNGATLNSSLSLGDLAAGAIGTAATTVDVYSGVTISPTVSGRTYTIPSPTTTTAGRTFYIANVNATNSFIVLGQTVSPNGMLTLVWGGPGTSWTVSGGTGANTALSNIASTNLSAALNTTSGNLTLQTTTSGNVIINPAGTVELQKATNVTGNLGVTGNLNLSGVTPAIAATTAATNLTINAGTTGLVQIGATSTGNIELGGGSASTGCTLTNSTGALACSSTLSGTQLISTIVTGTAPLTVASTTKVANLNVDALDGLDSTAFGQLSANNTWTGTNLFSATNANALKVQNASGTNLLTADTTNGQVLFGSYNGGTNPLAGKLVLANATNANTITLQTGTTSTSYTLTLPTAVGSTGQCLSATNGTGTLGWATCTTGSYINNSTSLQTSANFNIQSSATGNVTGVIRQLGSQTADLLQFQDSSATPVLKVNTDGNLLAGAVATATTGTTEATARTNVTSITLTADAFNVNDVIFFNNAGQDYYTRITVDNANGTYTVSPAVSYDASVTVTKYTIQNVGATATDYSTQSNRFFQGYFTGGVVAGAGSTVYSDGVISASPGLTVKNPTNTTTAFQVQDASGNNMMLTDTVNSIIKTGSYAGTSVIEEDLMTTMTGTLTGVATHVSGQYVELTHNVQGTDGQVDYTLSASSDFDTSFDFQTVGTADSVYMYAYTNSVPTEQSVAAGGYVVGFDEWTDSIKLFFNGTQLTSAAQGGMENGSWHSVSISKVGTNIKVYINSTLVIDYTDVQRTLSGTHFGLGGRSGGLTAYHRVKNFFFSASTTPGTNKSISTQVYGSSGVRSITNSTTAFLVQTAAGTNVLSVNTTSGTVQIGNTSDTLYNLLVLDNNNQSSDPACTNGGMYYNSSTHKFRGCQNGSWVNMAFGIDVQTYTMAGSSSWTKPSGVSTVMVILCGAGGGGGGGSTSLNSGSGGGGGAHVERFFLASDLTSTVTVTVGTGGSGGPAGSSGGFGSASSFGSYAYAGGGGVGTSGVKGGGGGGGVTSTTNDLGAENPTAGANGIGWQGASGGAVALNGGNSQHGGGGGGGARTNSSQTGMGGGSSAAGGTGGGSGGVSNGFAGGAGGKTGSWTAGGGAAGGTNAAGTAGSAATSTHCGTGGGGGGGSSTTGWAGGAGGAGGGGGGGGGAGTTAGGSGGNGADGRVWVISW